MAVRTPQQLKDEFAAGKYLTASKFEDLIDSVGGSVVRTHIVTTGNTFDLTNAQNPYYNLPIGSLLVIVNDINSGNNQDLLVTIGTVSEQGSEDQPVTLIINSGSSITLVKVNSNSENRSLIWTTADSATNLQQWEYIQ
jgi:hypothetical protein